MLEKREGGNRMAETQLTKDIKARCANFRPHMPTTLRTIRYAEEVDVLSGFVDVIRFEDYVKDNNNFCIKEEYQESCKFGTEPIYEETKCKACVHQRYSKELGILTTCFEVKISKSDFKSKNGHNFVGNLNYYAVPKDLVNKVVDLVPEGIGLIAYYASGNMRVIKESEFREVDNETLSRFLYNAMKKWCDQEFALDIGKSELRRRGVKGY